MRMKKFPLTMGVTVLLGLLLIIVFSAGCKRPADPVDKKIDVILEQKVDEKGDKTTVIKVTEKSVPAPEVKYQSELHKKLSEEFDVPVEAYDFDSGNDISFADTFDMLIIYPEKVKVGLKIKKSSGKLESITLLENSPGIDLYFSGSKIFFRACQLRASAEYSFGKKSRQKILVEAPNDNFVGIGEKPTPEDVEGFIGFMKYKYQEIDDKLITKATGQ